MYPRDVSPKHMHNAVAQQAILFAAIPCNWFHITYISATHVHLHSISFLRRLQFVNSWSRYEEIKCPQRVRIKIRTEYPPTTWYQIYQISPRYCY